MSSKSIVYLVAVHVLRSFRSMVRSFQSVVRSFHKIVSSFHMFYLLSKRVMLSEYRVAIRTWMKVFSEILILHNGESVVCWFHHALRNDVRTIHTMVE